MKRASLFVLSIAFSFCGYAQVKASATAGSARLTNPEHRAPFPYNHFVSSGVQDKAGNLWFGTSEGVYRYDGKLFTNYKVGDGLSLERVTKMMTDREGNIWIGANGGIVRVAALQGKGAPVFTSIKVPAAPAFAGAAFYNVSKPELINPVTNMAEGKNGELWFSVGYQVYRSRVASRTAELTGMGRFFKTEKVRMSCGDPDDFGVSIFACDDKGTLLITTQSCCEGYDVTYRLDAEKANNACLMNTCRHDVNNAQDAAEHNRQIDACLPKVTSAGDNANVSFCSLLKDRTGNVWVGTYAKGVYKYDGRHFARLNGNAELNKSTVKSIFEDKRGNIWFGTGSVEYVHGSGVFRYSPSGNSSIVQFTAQDGLCSGHPFSNNVITTIGEDNAGNIWFGGDGGVCYFSANGSPVSGSKSFVNFGAKEGMNDDHVSFVMNDGKGNMWLGAWGLGLYKYNGKTLTGYTDCQP